jgi:LuxR family maltose regulon positive regulatory protein
MPRSGPRHIPLAKITPPRLGVPLLARPRLSAVITQGVRRRLTLLTAEAGYGKTALLLAALPALDRPAAWVTLDHGETDPNIFAATMAAAVERACPEAPSFVDRVLLTGPDQAAVRALLVELLDEAPPLVVVLDDVHTVEDSAAVVGLVEGLLGALPPHIHLILASRTKPPLDGLPRLLVQGDAVTVGRDALRFTPDEVAEVLRSLGGVEPSGEMLETLLRRTEGWPAAVHLAALAAQVQGPQALSGTPREVYDYLAATVLDALPERIHAFLLRTAILSVFTPSLCRAVVPEVEPLPMLAEIERRNLFLDRLDEAGPTYRYHALFAEALRQRLAAQRGPDAVASLHRAAAQALEAAGAADRAVRHYIAAGAMTDAERVMKPLHGDRLTATLAYTFRDLVSRMPAEVLDRHPWMTRCGASAARFVGDYRLGLDLARRAMASAEGRDPDLWAFSVHGVGVMLGHLDRHEEVARLSESALPRLGPQIDPRFRRGVLTNLMDAYLTLGKVAEAARLLPALEALALEGTQPGRAFGIPFFQGAVAAARMEHTRAAGLFRAFLRAAEDRGSLTWQLWAWLALLGSEVARRRLPEARTGLARAREIQEIVRERDSELELSVLTGDVHLLAGAVEEAVAAYERTLAIRRDDESARPWILARHGLARAAAARGELTEAASRLRQAIEACERAGFGGLLPRPRLTELSLLRRTGDLERARAICAGLRETYRAWESPAGLALVAWWDLALGRGGDLQATTEEALALARPVVEDVAPWLTGEAAWVVPLLLRAMASGTDPATAASLIEHLGGAAVEPLIAALDDRAIRPHAVALLGAIGDPRARRSLRAVALKDPTLRAMAEDALRRLRAPEPVHLAIRMLGAFEVRRNGVPIAAAGWKTQKVSTLLKYLVLHRRRSVPQDELLEILWPEADPAAAAGRLKTAVKTLRQALEPLQEGTHSTFIVRHGDALRFEGSDRCWVDLDEYDALAAAARAHEEAGRLPEAAAALEQAAHLYTGDLLEDDRYEDWPAAERERRREGHIQAMEALADLYARRGDHRRAIAAIQRVLDLDRLREPAYRVLMTCLLARGDRDGALRAFQTCERLLREELGVAPQPETVALSQAARGWTPA